MRKFAQKGPIHRAQVGSGRGHRNNRNLTKTDKVKIGFTQSQSRISTNSTEISSD